MRIFPALLAFLLLLLSFQDTIIFLNFKLNQQYISTYLCVNRDKPELLCSGACFLNEVYQEKQQHESKSLPSFSENQLVFTCQYEPFTLVFSTISASKKVKVQILNADVPKQTYLGSLFHPPQYAVELPA